MIAHYTAAALVNELQSLAHPASVDTIPTSANQEDHVSMGANAALQLREAVDRAEQVLAIEASAPPRTRLPRSASSWRGRGLAHAVVRERVRHLDADRAPAPTSPPCEELRDGALLATGATRSPRLSSPSNSSTRRRSPRSCPRAAGDPMPDLVRLRGGGSTAAEAPMRATDADARKRLKRQRLLAAVPAGVAHAAFRTDAVERVAVGYAQFGPLSAHPRAQTIRDRYPSCPSRRPG